MSGTNLDMILMSKNKQPQRRYPPSHPKQKARDWAPFKLRFMDEGVKRNVCAKLAGALRVPDSSCINDAMDRCRSDEEWENNLYCVYIKYLQPDEGRSGAMHLDIVRRDRALIHDWRHLQRIKNELAGFDREAIEIYPAVSRLVDTANNYHLWVVPVGVTVEAGFPSGAVVGREFASRIGAKQRDYGLDDPTSRLCQEGEMALKVNLLRQSAGRRGADR